MDSGLALVSFCKRSDVICGDIDRCDPPVIADLIDTRERLLLGFVDGLVGVQDFFSGQRPGGDESHAAIFEILEFDRNSQTPLNPSIERSPKACEYAGPSRKLPAGSVQFQLTGR